MPWDGPLNTILSSLSGTVAHVLITVAVIVTGLVFAFTEHGSGARRLFGVAFGGALALGALSFMTAVGWAGATFGWTSHGEHQSIRRSLDRCCWAARSASWF
jgi:type IV secretory pathway VirB2 component (pilin)